MRGIERAIRYGVIEIAQHRAVDEHRGYQVVAEQGHRLWVGLNGARSRPVAHRVLPFNAQRIDEPYLGSGNRDFWQIPVVEPGS